MAKPKGSKFKKHKYKGGGEKKRPRGGGHGFTKTKELKEFEGSIPKSTPVRSTLQQRHFGSAEEEVYIVSSGSILDEKPRLATFNQLSTTAIVTGTTAAITPMETEEDFGFFFDSTPVPVETLVTPTTPLALPKTTSPISNYKRKKRKIIQDDSVYISSDDDDEEGFMPMNQDDDDVISISSSEDVDMLQALSHWGSNDIMQFNELSKKSHVSSDEEDYDLLNTTHLNQICPSDDDSDDDDNILLESEIDFDSLDNVPESLKNSYRGIIRQEKKRAKKQEKRFIHKQHKKHEREPPKHNGDLLKKIVYSFMKNSARKSYKLDNLTHHGRTIIVPKLAKLFQLDVRDAESTTTTTASDKRNTLCLVKTRKSSIPSSYYRYAEKNFKKKGKSNTTTTRVSTATKVFTSRVSLREHAIHGKQVASDSTPISSNNIGHRMLAAMGWKEGSSIGNNGDGIKEPVKVFMRANRRGLGA